MKKYLTSFLIATAFVISPLSALAGSYSWGQTFLGQLQGQIGALFPQSSAVQVRVAQPALYIKSSGGTITRKKEATSLSVVWSTVGVPFSVRLGTIKFVGSASGTEYILASNLLNTGSRAVLIPTTIPDGNYTLEIKMTYGRTTLSAKSSGYYTIVTPAVIPPSVSVISPNGGEVITRANRLGNFLVKWTAPGVPATARIETIRLRAWENGDGEYVLAKNTVNDGSQSVPIPFSIPDGPYTLEIKGNYKGVDFSDKSDAPFKIFTTPSIASIEPFSWTINRRSSQPIAFGVRWTTIGISSDTRMDVIRLRGVNSGAEYVLASDIVNSGHAVVAIPSDVPVGSYQLEIKTSYNGTTTSRINPRYINIVVPISPTSTSVFNPQTPTASRPSIISLSAYTGIAGSVITVNGNGLGSVNQINWSRGGVLMRNFSPEIISNTQIKFTIASGDIPAGYYEMTAVNNYGKSNAVTFTFGGSSAPAPVTATSSSATSSAQI